MNTYNPNGMNPNTDYNQQMSNPYMNSGSTYQQGNPYQHGNPYGQPGGGYNPNYGVPEKGPNIFKQFIYAFNPKKYRELAKVRTGSMIGFVFLLVFLITIIEFAVIMIRFSTLNVDKYLRDIPDFEVSDGEFYIEEDFLFDEDNTYIHITDEEDFSYNDIARLRNDGYQDIMLIGETQMCIYSDYEYNELPFSDIANLTINKTTIVEELMPMIKVIICIGYIFILLGRWVGYFFFALIYMLIGFIVEAIMKKNVSVGGLYKAAIYSKVVVFILSFFFTIMPFAINFPFLLGVIITVVFMIFAIKELPTRW